MRRSNLSIEVASSREHIDTANPKCASQSRIGRNKAIFFINPPITNHFLPRFPNSDDFNRPFVGFYNVSLMVELIFKTAKYKEHHGSYAEKRMDTALAAAAVGIVLFNSAYSFVMVRIY